MKEDASKTDLKVYDVYVKYVEMVMDDGDVLVYEAYSPFPRGHSIEKQLIKLSLKDAMVKINNMSDEDGLRMDYHVESEIFYIVDVARGSEEPAETRRKRRESERNTAENR